jgi:hypothetical protein
MGTDYYSFSPDETAGDQMSTSSEHVQGPRGDENSTKVLLETILTEGSGSASDDTESSLPVANGVADTGKSSPATDATHLGEPRAEQATILYRQYMTPTDPTLSTPVSAGSTSTKAHVQNTLSASLLLNNKPRLLSSAKEANDSDARNNGDANDTTVFKSTSKATILIREPSKEVQSPMTEEVQAEVVSPSASPLSSPARDFTVKSLVDDATQAIWGIVNHCKEVPKEIYAVILSSLFAGLLTTSGTTEITKWKSTDSTNWTETIWNDLFQARKSCSKEAMISNMIEYMGLAAWYDAALEWA